jgi:hypothetical protein
MSVLEDAFPGDSVWLSTMMTRNRSAFEALKSDSAFEFQLARYKTKSYAVMNPDSLTLWSRVGNKLVCFALIPASRSSVVGRVWDTPYVILALRGSDGTTHEISVNPGKAELRGRWTNKEEAYRKFSRWARGSTTEGTHSLG